MSRPLAMTAPRTFAILGVGLAIVGAVGTAVIHYAADIPVAGAFGFGKTAMVGYVIAGLTWASIGAVLVWRRPQNAVGWLLVLVGVGYALSQLTVSLTFMFLAEHTTQGDQLAQIAGWITVLLQLVAILQLAIGFLFPTGHVQSPGWARFMRLFWALAIVFVVISLTQPGPLQLVPAVDNPIGIGPDLRGGRPIAPILGLWTLIAFAGLGISMVSRYRSAGRVERLQMKWFVVALGLSAIALGVATWESVFMDGPVSGNSLTVYVFTGAVVPVAIGIAILRYHLYDIDRVISRTLGYGLVTGVLAAVFAATAIGLSAVLGSLAQGESLAVAAATLLVVGLFGPLRRRAQAVVDRRFDRARYDASLTVQSLTARLRDDVDIDRVKTDVLGVVDQTFHPASAGLWLR
jgi:MFS family permease